MRFYCPLILALCVWDKQSRSDHGSYSQLDGWRHSTVVLSHVLQFPIGTAGVVPLVQGSNGLCCWALFSPPFHFRYAGMAGSHIVGFQHESETLTLADLKV